MHQTIEGFRLSSQQARLWRFRQQSDAYRAWCSVLIEGRLEVTRFQQALAAVLARHEIYRTSFHRVPGVPQPLQVVKAETLSVWQSIDLRNIDPHEHQALLATLMQDEKIRVLDKEHGPLLSNTLLILTERTSLWSIFVSPLLADLHTLHRLVTDVARCYQSAATSAATILQYIQFSEWQHAFHAQERDDEALPWEGKDLATLSTLSLPFKAKTKTRPVFVPDVAHVPLGLTDTARLEALLEQASWTFPVFLLTCWSILLRRLTGHNEILIGLSADGRTEDLQEITGPLTVCLPLVCSLHEQQAMRDLLVQIEDAYEETLFSHLYFDGEELDRVTHPLLFSPPFGFEWREYPDRVTVGPVSFTVQDEECYTEPFQVKLIGSRGSTGVSLQIHFDRNLFACKQIQHMAEHLSLLVEHLIRHSEDRIRDLDVLSAGERQQLLVQFNATTAAYSQDCCVHELFEQQVARTPDAIALEYGPEVLSYQQLNVRANQLARHLQQLGIGPEALVGIAVEPSIAMIIAILGILKAGGAYVPLDTNSPKLRLASMVANSHLSVLVTQSSLQADLPIVKSVVCLDTEWAAIERWSADNLVPGSVHPSNLAYVLYTSGSTGEPKGVMIPHRGLVHYVDWSSRHYGAAQGTGSPVHSPLSFDLTITSVFPSLIVGSRVVLIPNGPGIESLCETLLIQQGFSLLKITPAHLTLLTQSLQPEAFAAVAQTLVVGGEALHSESVKVWRQYAPETRMINEYGPTETVVGCCIHEVAGDEELEGIVPIGRPIPNTQLYVLDTHLRLMPIGVAGELYIGGVGVGRGYLNRPDLTAERFLANPLSEEPGMRLYKTGDAARYISADGTLEYLGRIDQQVKLRGYRIEPGEIEEVLRRHPQVRTNVVVLREDASGEPCLVAYVVTRQRTPIQAEQLREFLLQLLPEYLIPTLFIQIDALPLTANGKVDRQRLPAPDKDGGRKQISVVSPRSQIEKILLELWKDLLGMSTVGIQNDFFALGGHSLLATRLIARIQATLQVEIPVRTVFDAPNVEALAERIELALGRNEGRKMPPLVAVARPEEIPLSFAQQRLWFLDQLEPGSTAYLVPMAHRLQGEIDVYSLEHSVDELIRRHESLRTTFAERAGQAVQVIHPARSYLLPVIDLQMIPHELREQEAQRLASQEAQHPYNLAKGPLLRVYLLRLEQELQVLLLTLHHIITDGWSNDVLVGELITLYRAYVSGKPSPLAPLPIQYADYALWQRAWLQGDVLEAQLAYWTRQLGGAPSIQTPTDYPRPSRASSRGASHPFVLSEALSQALITLSRQEGVTLFMLLLAAFQVLFYRSTGQVDIVIGTDSANRHQIETEGIIGFFINLLALRTDLSGNPPFREVLKRVREGTLGAYTHQDTPFDLLVEKLVSDHYLDRTPLIQVLFVLQDTLLEPEEGTDAEAQVDHQTSNPSPPQLAIDKETSIKFDMALFMQKSAGKLSGILNYRLDLFKASTIATMTARFETLLQSIVKEPNMPIDLLEYVSDGEHVPQEQKEQRLQPERWTQNDGWSDLSDITFTI